MNKTIDDKVEFQSYGDDLKFFKFIGKDLYYNTGTVEKPKYDLLKKGYKDERL